MNKSMNTLVAASVLAALMGSGAALAEVSANIGATSNYVWRGITQSADDSAISGGLDYSHDSGVYVGTWTSSTAFGSPEVDLYGGFAKEFSGVGVDLSLTRYAYPTDAGASLDWTEAKVALSYGPATFTAAMGQDVFGNIGVDSRYAALDLSHSLKDDLSVGLHMGAFDFTKNLDNTWVGPAGAEFEDRFYEYGVSLSKGEFTFTVSDTTLDKDLYAKDGQYRMYASYTKAIDL